MMMRAIKFVLAVLTSATVIGAISASSPPSNTVTEESTLFRNQTPAPAKLEGCVSCHGLIEPMHKYGTTDTLDKLKDGKDAVGLSCTACHGGNPLPSKTSEDPKEIER